MDNNLNFSKDKMDLLLNIAGKKLGTDPSQLKQQLSNGNLDQALGGLNASQISQVNHLLSNPQALEQMLNSPKVKDMLTKLMEGR